MSLETGFNVLIEAEIIQALRVDMDSLRVFPDKVNKLRDLALFFGDNPETPHKIREILKFKSADVSELDYVWDYTRMKQYDAFVTPSPEEESKEQMVEENQETNQNNE